MLPFHCGYKINIPLYSFALRYNKPLQQFAVEWMVQYVNVMHQEQRNECLICSSWLKNKDNPPCLLVGCIQLPWGVSNRFTLAFNLLLYIRSLSTLLFLVLYIFFHDRINSPFFSFYCLQKNIFFYHTGNLVFFFSDAAYCFTVLGAQFYPLCPPRIIQRSRGTRGLSRGGQGSCGQFRVTLISHETLMKSVTSLWNYQVLLLSLTWRPIISEGLKMTDKWTRNWLSLLFFAL